MLTTPLDVVTKIWRGQEMKDLFWLQDSEYPSFESEFYWIAWSFHFLHSYLALYTGNQNM